VNPSRLIMLFLSSLSLCTSGCLFDHGSASVLNGPVNLALECDPSPPPDGCPSCSTAEGPSCRDHWYSAALRCNGDAQCGGTAGTCQLGFCVAKDLDHDGIDDDFEREVAELNFPRVLMATGESCGTPHGVVYRVRRHPANPQRFAITYVVMYANDCGELTGHVGDAESFAVTVDPNAAPGAAAAVGVAAWAHAGTACASTSSCATEAATNECSGAPASAASSEVVIYSSREKHGNYLSVDTCNQNCFDSCSAGERIVGPLLNVGEPDHPLVTDLTAQGFVQGADGWANELLHFNPWGSVEFSGGGRVDTPLTNLTAPPGR
jgi:hypothetical protein